MAHHVIIVDDRESNIEVLGMLLANQGVTYTGYSGHDELMANLNGIGQVSAVFLDLELSPDYGYYHTLHTLRQHPRFGNVPMVAYTVHISEIEKARAEGFDHFLAKPISALHFPRHLARILNGEPVWEY